MAFRDLPQLRIVAAPPAASDRASVAIYRPFFLAGIFCVLTVGCLLGAVALLGISLRGDYLATAWTPFVLAHANSQLYGWVGFFVMGFALQQHAPSIARADRFHRLAMLSMGLMGAGIAVRFLAEPLAGVDRATWVPIGVLSALWQLAAVLVFLYNSGANRHRTGQPLTYPTAFVFASLFWLTLVAAVEPFFFAASHQPDRLASVMFVAEWFAPYREAQFLGFASMMIFGVALTKFSGCLGFQAPRRNFALLGFGLWMLGLLVRMGGWILAFRAGMAPERQGVFFLGGALLAAGAVAMVLSLRVFEDLRYPLPSQRFIRAAFGWLLAAGGLLLLEPLHLRAVGMPFSHAYTGAIRHAVTVGFISQMIVGVGTHVVAKLNGQDELRLPSLVPTLILLNVGNALRVATEIGTDLHAAAFMPMGITGFVELLGLLIWASVVARILLSRRHLPTLGSC